MIIKPKVKIISHTPNPEKVVSIGAKLCYSPSSIEDIEKGLDKDAVDKFITMLNKLGHESPLEHVTFTFGIENVSRALTHQLVRHRLSSFSQQSQRYVKEVQFEYIIPEGIRDNKVLTNKYISMMEQTQKNYDELVADIIYECIAKDYTYSQIIKEGRSNLGKQYEKYAIENARYVLPNACETKILVTMNARTLINFFKLRTCRRSQAEIRELTEEMYHLVMQIAPSIFRNKIAGCISDNKCPEGKMCCGNPRDDLKEMYINEQS